MKCPYCAHGESRVVDSRPTDDSIRRRRECDACQKRFTTYETVESLPMLVVKRDGARQAFDRGKLLRSLMRACDKRSVTLEQLEELTRDVENQLQGSLEREVPSQRLGDLVMERLRALDEVAYVRFASVYRRFTDVSTFLTEVNRMLGVKNAE